MRVSLAHMMQHWTSTPCDITLNIEIFLHTLTPQHGHAHEH